MVASLEGDIQKVRRILELVEGHNQYSSAIGMEQIQDIMGANVISADAYKQFGWDVESPVLPEGLTEELLPGNCAICDGPVTENEPPCSCSRWKDSYRAGRSSQQAV